MTREEYLNGVLDRAVGLPGFPQFFLDWFRYRFRNGNGLDSVNTRSDIWCAYMVDSFLEPGRLMTPRTFWRNMEALCSALGWSMLQMEMEVSGQDGTTAWLPMPQYFIIATGWSGEESPSMP